MSPRPGWLVTLPQSLAERFIHDGLQRQLNPPALRPRVHHEDREHVVDGIDEIERAAGAVPAVFAERPAGARRRRGAHGEAETEAAVGTREIKGFMEDARLRSYLVLCH